MYEVSIERRATQAREMERWGSEEEEKEARKRSAEERKIVMGE